MTTFPYDLRHAARTLRRYPGFCVVNAVLFRPLDFPQADRLVALHEHFLLRGIEGVPFSPPEIVGKT